MKTRENKFLLTLTTICIFFYGISFISVQLLCVQGKAERYSANCIEKLYHMRCRGVTQ